MLMLGCASSYDFQSSGGDVPTVRLPVDASILITMPEDGRHGTQVSPGSGELLLRSIISELSAHGRDIRSTEAPASFEENLENARAQGLGYMLVPRILLWEERTFRSSKRSGIAVKLRLVDVASEEVIDTTVFTAKGPPKALPSEPGSVVWLVPQGEPDPDFLSVPLGRYAEAIFAQ